MPPISVLSRWKKLGYTQDCQSLPPKYPTLVATVLFPRDRLDRNTNISTEDLYPGTIFHLDLSFFNKVSCRKFTSSLTIVDAITRHLFVYTTISKSAPLQIIKTFIKFSRHHGYKISIFRADEGGEHSRSADFMQIFIDHEDII